MGGFDFDSAAADADTAVSPAEPEPLDDLDSHADAHAPTHDGVDARLDALLYAGEKRRASLPVATGHLVATDHRVLAYAPDANPDERATLRAVHRVNVTDVSLSSSGADWLVRPVAYAVLGGLAMVIAGSVVSFDSMSASMPDSAGATGVGGLLSMIGGVLSVLSLVDDLLRVVGALSLLVGAGLLGAYARSRGGEVAVETEGEADTLRVAAGDADSEALARFRADAGLADGDGKNTEHIAGRLRR
ncbi:hypothetical protein Hbl1158_04025 [Halobaculum sp. CBA1158]|uniref:hypothetical protein n=1 Tax=Halobaculum sp. CBA1158 TaxID=2904243 RepID=UPI001F4400CE|nr:hypothetical protein [Halobaculum sp. CBA1158]UIP00538.1 hypothetical protein Hbl1158_04025 [Halobaculum sp. CBA1158]